MTLTRRDLGLPSMWSIIVSWLVAIPGTEEAEPAETWDKPDLKNPEVPQLSSYASPPSNTFWNKFPSSKNLKGKREKIRLNELKKLVQKCWFRWTLPEKNVAKKALRRLRGETVKMLHHLPAVVTKNAKSAVAHGKWITDTIATWIKRGYVMGPFAAPPLKLFRSNPLMAAVQKTKVRPIMNLSSPKGRSFNDAVNPWFIEKLSMSSPRLFGESLLKMGEGAVFSKSDIQDAYKLIPNATEQRRLYGFKWLGKFFYDKTTVFGSAAAPAWFDPLSELVVQLVCSLSNIPRKYVDN